MAGSNRPSAIGNQEVKSQLARRRVELDAMAKDEKYTPRLSSTMNEKQILAAAKALRERNRKREEKNKPMSPEENDRQRARYYAGLY